MSEPHYKIRNWERFQHYHKPRPAWIKLHRTLLDDIEFQSLSTRSRVLLVMLWLIAAESDDGTIPGPKDIAWRLRLPFREVSSDIQTLTHYLEPLYSNSRASLVSDRDRDREETETEYSSSGDDGCGGEGFDEFWKLYPRKVGKGAARKEWAKIKKRSDVIQAIRSSLSWQITSEQWMRDNGQYIPHPRTYLSHRRWEDERPRDAFLDAVEK